MDSHSPPKRGLGFIMIVMALLVGWGMWMTTQRTVRIDDAAKAGVDAKWPEMRLNINNASAAELSALPGLGPALSQRIVDDRDQRGSFTTLDDMKRVSGIGPAIVERIRPYVVVE